MEDPEKELPDIVRQLTTAESPDEQKRTIERYFLPDAGFNHPLCTVPRGKGSRDQILRVYQWYRVLSPKLQLSVDSCHWDPRSGKAFVAVTQTFHLFFSPFPGHPAKLLVRLTLTQRAGKFYIMQQEDFYAPEELGYIVFPPLGWAVGLAKWAGTWASIWGAWGAQRVLGWWKPKAE